MTKCLDYSQMRHDFAMWGNGGTPVSTMANDGFEPWPVANLRAGGFDSVTYSGIDMTTSAAFSLPLSVVAEGGAESATYLHQKTDDATKQYLFSSYSAGGVVTLTFTALGLATNGGSANFDIANKQNFRRFWENVHLYFCRKSDGAIYWVDLYAVLAARGVT